MKGENNIDKLVKDTLASAQTPSFNEAHWAQSQAFVKAQKRKRRRKAAYWLATAAVFLFFSLWMFIDYSNGNKPQQVDDSELAQETTKSSSKPSYDNVTKDGLNPNSKRPETIDSATTGSVIESEHNLASNSDRGQTALSIDNEGKPRNNINDRGGLTMTLVPGQRSKDNETGSGSGDSNGNLNNDRETSSRLAIHLETGAAGTQSVNKKKSDELETTLAHELDESDRDKENGNGSESGGTQKSSLGPDSLSTPIALVDDSVSEKDSAESEKIALNDDTVFAKPVTELEPKPFKLKGFFMIPYLGYTYSSHMLQGNHTSLINKRNAEEQRPFTPDLGFSAKYYFDRGMYLGSGFGVYQFGENAKYSAMYDTTRIHWTERVKTGDRDDGFFNYTDSAQDPITGEYYYTKYEWVSQMVPTYENRRMSRTEVDSVESREVKNRYTYLEIPLVVGYNHYVGNWFVGADVGPSLNLLLAVNGAYPNVFNAEYQSIDRSQYRLLGYGLTSSLNVGRELNEHFVLSGSLRYRQQLTIAEKVPRGALRSKYSSVGLQTRLIYRF